jgi:hypothetical protein
MLVIFDSDQLKHKFVLYSDQSLRRSNRSFWFQFSHRKVRLSSSSVKKGSSETTHNLATLGRKEFAVSDDDNAVVVGLVALAWSVVKPRERGKRGAPKSDD